ncbi:MAG: ABC transporter ATP-binding protein [Beijerinckiaceae bacterium]|nr:ABC transporter ATP-binding protein [Beijerinckiaceae bacterium]
MLRLEAVHGGYGPAEILFGMSFAVNAGEVVALMGRNGMGKTTTIKTIMGLLTARAGVVRFNEADVTGWPPFKRAQAGLGLVPEGRQIFPNLTVAENLVATASSKGTTPKWTLERVFGLFPRLKERRGNFGDQLSGGEQQMLAIGRALMTNPALLILDEATEGLAPIIRQEIWACLAALKHEGEAILVVDKNLKNLLDLADRHVIIERGKVVWSGTSAALRANPAEVEAYLQV